jgi:hypothetical protein
MPPAFGEIEELAPRDDRCKQRYHYFHTHMRKEWLTSFWGLCVVLATVLQEDAT